jgi:hypothetical protein
MFQKIRISNLVEGIGNSSTKLRGFSRYGPVVVTSSGSVLTVRINEKAVLMLPTLVPELSVAEILGLTGNMFEWDF